MDHISHPEGRTEEIVTLFTASFTASEGAAEGAHVGGLARNLLDSANDTDLHVFGTLEDGALIAAVLFTRLTYAADPRRVVLLSPMAVRPDRQGRGIGQALLRHALDSLRAAGTDIVLTYGDVAFYGKLGFQPMTQAEAPAPHPLSYPEGWLGLSLTGQPIGRLAGPSACVPAFDDAAYW